MSVEPTPTNQRTAQAARLERLRVLLADGEVSVKELAQQLGVSEKTLSLDLRALGRGRRPVPQARAARLERLRTLLADGKDVTVEELAQQLGVDRATVSADLRALGVPDRRAAPMPASERQARMRELLAADPALRPNALARMLGLPTTTAYRDWRALGLGQPEDEVIPA